MSLERGLYNLVGGSVELSYLVDIRGRCLILRRLGGDFSSLLIWLDYNGTFQGHSAEQSRPVPQ